jgi:hypothetical protein
MQALNYQQTPSPQVNAAQLAFGSSEVDPLTGNVIPSPDTQGMATAQGPTPSGFQAAMAALGSSPRMEGMSAAMPGLDQVPGSRTQLPFGGKEDELPDLPLRPGERSLQDRPAPTPQGKPMEDLMNEPMSPMEMERLRKLFGTPGGGGDLPQAPPVKLIQPAPGQEQRYPTEMDRLFRGPAREPAPANGPPIGPGMQPGGQPGVPDARGPMPGNVQLAGWRDYLPEFLGGTATKPVPDEVMPPPVQPQPSTLKPGEIDKLLGPKPKAESSQPFAYETKESRPSGMIEHPSTRFGYDTPIGAKATYSGYGYLYTPLDKLNAQVYTYKSYGDKGMKDVHYLIPNVDDRGQMLSPKAAEQQFMKTGLHLGQFKTPQDAEAFRTEAAMRNKIDFNRYNADPYTGNSGFTLENEPATSSRGDIPTTGRLLPGEEAIRSTRMPLGLASSTRRTRRFEAPLRRTPKTSTPVPD